MSTIFGKDCSFVTVLLSDSMAFTAFDVSQNCHKRRHAKQIFLVVVAKQSTSFHSTVIFVVIYYLGWPIMLYLGWPIMF